MEAPSSPLRAGAGTPEWGRGEPSLGGDGCPVEKGSMPRAVATLVKKDTGRGSFLPAFPSGQASRSLFLSMLKSTSLVINDLDWGGGHVFGSL